MMPLPLMLIIAVLSLGFVFNAVVAMRALRSGQTWTMSGRRVARTDDTAVFWLSLAGFASAAIAMLVGASLLVWAWQGR